MSCFDPVEPIEVERIIQRLQPKTSPLDIVPIAVFKQCKTELSVVIAHLANLSFASGRFPTIWKKGLVTPLLKKTGLDVNDLKNFRPITNLSTISKIIERLAQNRLKRFITESPNFGQLQSAYRQGHSTETALTKMMDDIIRAVDEGCVVALMSLDISAAFDAVDHDVLVERLENEFGITGTCSQWIRSYLTDRSSVVRVGKSLSAAVPVRCGVPQGSVLGPMLYTAYVSPVGRLIGSFGILFHQYADDTQVYNRLTMPVSPAIGRLLRCIEVLQHWFWRNGLLLNPDKTVISYFGTRSRRNRPDLPRSVTVAGCDVAVSDKLTVLGVTIDSGLSMDQHVNSVVKNCNYHLQALRHIRPSLSRDAAAAIACSIVHSRLDYCNALLVGTTSSNLDKLQRVQNRAARIVSVASRQQSGSRDLLLKLHWLPVASRITFKTATLCYKALRLGQPSYLSSTLIPYNPVRRLRSSSLELLDEPFVKTKIGGRRFSAVAPRVWNKLPLDCRTADSLSVFKSRLKTHLFRRFMD